MKRLTNYEELIVDALYDDLDETRREQFEQLLREDSEFRTLFEKMGGTLTLMGRRERRDPGEAYWEGYFGRLDERLAEGASESVAVGPESQSWWRRNVGSMGTGATWATRAAAAAAILVMGVFVGRTFFLPAEQTATIPTPVETASPREVTPLPSDGGDVELASADDRAMRYVEKSRVLLLGLVNADTDDDGTGAGFEVQRRQSRSLVTQAAGLREELDDPSHRRLRALVGELEKIMMQIANLESEEDFDEVELIRGRVDKHDVMLKIDLEELRHDKQRVGAKPDASTSGSSAPNRSI